MTNNLIHCDELTSKIISLLVQYENGNISKDQLIHHDRLSFSKIGEILNTNMRGTRVFSNPKTYKAYADLKFSVEERVFNNITLEEVELKYKSTISRLSKVGAQNTSELQSSSERALYEKVRKHNHWPLMKWFCVEVPTAEYWYWSDKDIIKQCGKYKSMTNLHCKATTLERHMKCRGLEPKVRERFSQYIPNKSYVSGSNELCRSYGELTISNLIHLCERKNDFEHQPKMGLHRKGSDKTMVADYYCKPNNIHIELTMYTHNGRGKRGKQYIRKLKEKKKIYENNKVNCIFIDSSVFFNSGCFDHMKFSEYFCKVISENGYNKLNTKNIKERELCLDKQVKTRLDLHTEEFLNYLRTERGLEKTADLSNHLSNLNAVIKARPDSKELFELLKSRGIKLRNIKNSKRARKRPYAKLTLVREIFRRFNIRSQKQWYTFAKNNKQFLRALHVPVALPEVYRLRGMWDKGWAYLTQYRGKGGVAIHKNKVTIALREIGLKNITLN